MKTSGKEIILQLIHYTIGIAVIVIVVSLTAAARLGVKFRSDFSTILIAIFLLYLVISLFPGKTKFALLFSFIAFLFAIPLTGLWGSGQSEQYLISGIIPFSDARFYYMDARRLLEGDLFSTGAGRRPLFAALLASIQWMTGQNLYVSLTLLIVVIALTTYFAMREIHSSENAVAAGFFLILIFFYIRFLLGKTMSEMIGLPFGLLAFFFLYRSSTRKQIPYFLFGLYLLTLGLNARAGAFFILPMLVLWGAFAFAQPKRFNWRVGVLGVLVVVAGFVTNLLVFNQLSKPDSTPFGNFSFTLYGLSRGGQSWTLVYEEHPEISTLPGDEAYSTVYQMAFENVRNNPAELLKGIAGSYAMFFSLDDYYGSLCWFGGSNAIGAAARLVVFLLMAVGLITTTIKFNDPTKSLMVAAFFGIILSVMVIPPRDSNHMRVFAATFPFFAILPVSGLSFLFSKLPNKRRIFADNPPALSPILPGILSMVLILLITVVPLVIKGFASKPVPAQITCPKGLTSLSFRVLPGNFINIHEQGSLEQDWLPNLQKNNFARLAHDLPNWELFPVLTGIEQDQMMISDLNLYDMKEMILITNRDAIKPGTEIQSICATYQDAADLALYNVYIAD
jgi:hypothetical protein